MAGEQVLVIDDSPTILKVVQLVLTKAGFKVATATDGEEGIAQANAGRPDLILLDFVMPKMNGYQVCRALNESALLKDVPVTHLLFLEKQLVDIHTFVEKLPTLDPAEAWQYNPEVDCFASDPYQTAKTKKVLKNHVKAEATKEHPAQVETYTEDVVVGYWTTVKFSGALPAREKNAILQRVRKLQEAVKSAREEANSVTVEPKKTGAEVFKYIFGTE